jgi:hypothetical protein
MSTDPQEVLDAVQPTAHSRRRNRRAAVILQGTLPPAPRVRRIHDAASVAAELVSLYREMRKGRLDTVEGCRLAHVLHLAGRILAELDTAKAVAQLRAELQRIQAQPDAPILADYPALAAVAEAGEPDIGGQP